MKKLWGNTKLTRDELIAKRKRKKRRRAAAIIVSAAAVCLLAAGVVRMWRGGRVRLPGQQMITPGLDAESLEESPQKTENMTTGEAPIRGWQSDLVGRYYINSDGTRLTGWFNDSDGKKYLFDSNGYALTGWKDPDIGRVYFDENGALAIGLAAIDGSLYYFGYDGVMLTGWHDEGNKTYYFDKETGTGATGWKTINGEDCFFDENGIYDPQKKKRTDGPAVALTFDDGPGPYTGRLLDILTQYNAKATFFMLGELVNDYASVVQRGHELGMEQGNHTWDHKILTHLSDGDIRKEISSTNDVIQSVTGSAPTLFRPPGGGYNSSVLANCGDKPVILWSIDTLDWKTKNVKQTYRTVIDNVTDGSIILMHDIYSQTVDAAEMIIPELLERGYRLVTVSELASEKGIALRAGKTYGSLAGG